MARKQSVKDSQSARARLISAGETLFADRTIEDVSASEIATAAGVAHGLLFHYFKTKLNFYIEVFRASLDKAHSRRQAVTMQGSPEERLRLFVKFHVQFVHARMGSYIYYMRGGAPAEVMAVAEESRMNGVRLVLSFFSDIPPTNAQLYLGRAWLGLTSELILAWMRDDSLDEDGIVEASIGLFHQVLARAPIIDPAERAKSSTPEKRAPSLIG